MFAEECSVAVVSAVPTPDGRSVARPQSRFAKTPTAGFGLPGLCEGQPGWAETSEGLRGNSLCCFGATFGNDSDIL